MNLESAETLGRRNRREEKKSRLAKLGEALKKRKKRVSLSEWESAKKDGEGGKKGACSASGRTKEDLESLLVTFCLTLSESAGGLILISDDR